MKKLLTIAAFLGAVTMSYGQGQVNFSAGGTAASRVSTNSVPGGPTTGQTGPVSTGYQYYYALFVADSTITSAGAASASGALDPTLTAGWAQVIWNGGNPAGVTGGAYATNTIAGRFTGNPTTDDVFVAGRVGGSQASFIVVGWSSQVAGQDWASAKAWIDAAIGGNAPSTGWTGASGVATSVTLGNGGLITPGNIFGSSAGQIPGGMILAFQPVPEPSTFALAGLGAATLLIFRRRKN
jgi:hypothetical protein